MITYLIFKISQSVAQLVRKLIFTQLCQRKPGLKYVDLMNKLVTVMSLKFLKPSLTMPVPFSIMTQLNKKRYGKLYKNTASLIVCFSQVQVMRKMSLTLILLELNCLAFSKLWKLESHTQKTSCVYLKSKTSATPLNGLEIGQSAVIVGLKI